MVLFSTIILVNRYCFRSPLQNKVKKDYWLTLKQKFSTTSNVKTRGRWGEKTKIESFQPQFENIPVDVNNLSPGRLVKPFFFTLAFSTASLSGAAIWQYENSRPIKYQEWKIKRKNLWNGLNAAMQIFAPICLVNILIFLAWRVPQFEATMIRYFCSNPAARNNCWPMVLSTFSHHSLLHIFANMYVLQSFCTAATISMGKEQVLGFYMAAGVISSFASYVYKVMVSRPGLSLGASGAIMGILGYTCVTYPDIQLSIILLPFITFKAGIAIKVLMGVDLAGCILGWRFFDHAAHLGGALFGIFWGLYGHQYIWQKREVIIRQWKELKKVV